MWQWPEKKSVEFVTYSLHWRHNDHDGVSNHQPHGCLLNRLFGRGSEKTPKLRVTGLSAGNSPGPVNSPHKGPVTRKMFPFDDVIMLQLSMVCTHFSPVDRGHYRLVLWTALLLAWPMISLQWRGTPHTIGYATQVVCMSCGTYFM